MLNSSLISCKIHHNNLCIGFGTWKAQHLNQSWVHINALLVKPFMRTSMFKQKLYLWSNRFPRFYEQLWNEASGIYVIKLEAACLTAELSCIITARNLKGHSFANFPDTTWSIIVNNSLPCWSPHSAGRNYLERLTSLICFLRQEHFYSQNLNISRKPQRVIR